MNRTTLKGIPAKLALGLLVLVATAAPSFAVELAAVPATATMPDPDGPDPLTGEVIAMWGFIDLEALPIPTTAAAFDCSTVDPLDPWGVGPTLTATAGGSLTVNLKNCLAADPVSVFIPGQLKGLVPVHEDKDGTGRMRVTSFDTVTAAGGGVQSYDWTGVKEGTYLYHSGTHPQVQVQMGLYGALVVSAVSGGSYPDVAQEEVLVYSEIDPALHAAVDGGTYGTAAYPSTFDYMPRYFLINGAAYPDGADITIDTLTDVLLRFVNAGLRTHVPTLEGGLYMSLIAEDGNLYKDGIGNPIPFEQYGVELQAAKTIDAVVNVGTAGTYALYDRALGLTNWLDTGGGMLTYIQAGAASCSNDADCDDGLFCNGAETCNDVTGLCEPGTPPPCDNGVFCDGAETCNEGTNTCDPGTPPTCDDGVTCTDDSCNVGSDSCDNLANDANCPDDGLFCNGNEFCDAVLDCSSTGDPCPSGETCNEVGNICELAPNIPPVANDDFATTVRNTAVTFSVTGNDTDADGSIAVATVDLDQVLDGRQMSVTTQRGGLATVDDLGNVTFDPRRGFRGTDLFTYTVLDNDGAISNVATVRVNVVRP